MNPFKWIGRVLGGHPENVPQDAPPPLDPSTDELMDRCRTVEAVFEAAKASDPAPTPPLVAAYERVETDKAVGRPRTEVEVSPGGPRVHAGGFTVDVHELTPENVLTAKIRLGGINNVEPPDDLTPHERALYLHYIRLMPEADRANLYRAGGTRLVRETVVAVVRRTTAASETARQLGRDAA
jgi:hypothetical protein